MMSLACRSSAVLFGLVLLAGCSQGEPTTVSGQLTLDGSPLAGANLQLIGASDAELGMHSAATNAEGKFTFTEPGDSTTPIKPGSYVLLVSKRVLPADAANLPGGGMGADLEVVPAEYQDRAQSPLKVEVQGAKTELPPMAISRK